MLRALILGLLLLATPPSFAGAISDFGEWTVVADPPSPSMYASLGNSNTDVIPPDQDRTLLVAVRDVPSGTDIGYASVDGAEASTATSGYYFDPASDFTLAIDFYVRSSGSIGGGGFGFGIGEDAAGINSAGVGGFVVDGGVVAMGTAARVADVDQPIQVVAVPGLTSGRLFVEHRSATKDVILGVHPSPGAAGPSTTQTLTGVASQWGGQPLLASFFLRSQQVELPPLIDSPALAQGQLDVTFANFEVLSGTAIAIVPEPTTSFLATLVLLTSGTARRR